MNKSREVLITGAGVVSPIGIGFSAYWQALKAQHSGVVFVEPFHSQNMPFHIGAPLKNFDGKDFVQPRKAMKVMSREIQAAYAAADLALKHANITKEQIDPERFGIVLGSEILYGELNELSDVFRHCLVNGEFDFQLWGKNAMSDIFPLWMLKYLPNMAACHVGIAHDARGPNNTITLGEVSSLLAIMEACNYIRRGHADIVLAGGSGSKMSQAALPFRGALNVSHYDGEPANAMRPFDSTRAGMVYGEGAAVFVLESREHAARRQAQGMASILGYASRSEAGQRENMSGQSIRNALTGALQSANMVAASIGHMNAHGVATKHDDALEAQAIHDIFGNTPVTAPKSYFGHLGAGTGAVELAASLGALMYGEIPPTLNYNQADAACPIQVVRKEMLSSSNPTAMIMNHNSTGQAAALVLGPA